MTSKISVSAIGVIAVCALPLAAQQPGPPDNRGAASTAMATRVAQAPAIDGRNNDAIWQSAPKFADFRQFQPRVNVDPSFKTEFQVGFDERNLYVFLRMYDPHPDSIMRALTRRDVRGPSDQIKVMIDSYDDKRSGYEFAVNPDGVKRDFAMSNDGNEDASWNGVWDVATAIDSLGWTAEFRIPLSQLRYRRRRISTRLVSASGATSNDTRSGPAGRFMSLTKSGLSSQLGRLTGITGITSTRRVEITPYTVTKNVQRNLTAGGFERSQQVTGGGDMKLGLTPNVTLDATVNPDFGQVEADPAVLNLSAFETFLREQPPVLRGRHRSLSVPAQLLHRRRLQHE